MDELTWERFMTLPTRPARLCRTAPADVLAARHRVLLGEEAADRIEAARTAEVEQTARLRAHQLRRDANLVRAIRSMS